MKVISMVPSWTETLIRCGVEVVGRTRYCIHPAPTVKDIPVVGGTKNIDWKKVSEIGADLLILDQEENPKSMAEEATIPYLVTHIEKVSDVSRDLFKMAEKLSNEKLRALALRWEKVADKTALTLSKDFNQIPGIIKWINPLKPHVTSFIYLIWKNPWMAVSKKTFIGSVFETLGLSTSMIDFTEKYPQINLDLFDPEKTLLLFSTEPFPFGKKIDLVKDLPFPSAIIDGECYSWFGLRTLEFLEKNL